MLKMALYLYAKGSYTRDFTVTKTKTQIWTNYVRTCKELVHADR